MTTLQLTQRRLLEMAQEIHSVLDSHSIPYIITYGTLLGAVRHKGFIPWDDDFDIYLFDDSYDYAISVLRNNLQDSFFLEDSKSEPLYFHGWAHVKDLNSEAICHQFPQDNIYSHHGLSIDLYKATLIPREQLSLYQLTEKLKYCSRKFQHNLIDGAEFHRIKEQLSAQIEREELKGISYPNDMIYGFMSLDGDYLEVKEIFPIKKYEFEGFSFNGPAQYHYFLTRCYGNYMELPPVEKRVPHYSKVLFH